MIFNMRRFSGVNAFFALTILFVVFASQAGAAGLHERAKNLYDVGDYRAALNLYERILRDDPNDGLAWDVSAWCLRYLGESKSAEENYKKALLLLKGEDAIWSLVGLGELYIDGGRYDDALAHLREAKDLAAGSEEAAERAVRDIEIAEKALADVRLAVSDDAAVNGKTEMTDADDRRAIALLEKRLPEADAKDDPAPLPESDDIAQAAAGGDESPAKTAETEESTSERTVSNPDDIAQAAAGGDESSAKTAETEESTSERAVSNPDDIAQAAASGDERPAKAAKTEKSSSGRVAPNPAPKKSMPKKPAPEPKPEKTQRPSRNDVIYGVKLGSPINEALEILKKQGCLIDGEPFAMNNKEFYAVTGLNAALPDVITDGSTRGRFYIVSLEGAVFSVNAELDYDRDMKFDLLKEAARSEIGNISGRDDMRGLIQIANIFSFEMNLAVSNTYGVSILVVDKGDGTSRIEIQHIDLYGLSDYLSGKNVE